MERNVCHRPVAEVADLSPPARHFVRAAENEEVGYFLRALCLAGELVVWYLDWLPNTGFGRFALLLEDSLFEPA